VALQSTVAIRANAGGAKQVYRTNPFTNQAANDPKMRSDDRIIVLRPIKGKNTLNSIGLVDHRLLKGDSTSRLHAKLDPTGLWYLFMDNGGKVPESMSGKWTRWDDCIRDLTAYFKKRNIEIIEVID